MRTRWFALFAAVMIGGCATALDDAVAQAAASDSNVPLIAGRVSALEGNVDIWRTEEDGDGRWDDAQVNDVVTVGTGIATDDRARAEVRVGPHAFRLGGATSAGFSQLDFNLKLLNLERGVASVALAPAQQGEIIAVMAGGVQVDMAAPGRYRVDAIDGAPLRVSVLQGQATARYNGNDVAVGAGQALVLTQSNVSYASANTTALDEWGIARDQHVAVVPPAVSPYMTGAEELSNYGDWMPDATYGTLWVPRAVPVGWAPYRYGRWRWVAPWGWTWVDAAPWGYAPFHYGRWVTVGGRWCWWPGRYVARPVWAPALVGFVGGGVNVSVSFGGPVVGWYPLAPWNPYRPYYRTNNTYVTVINQTIINKPPVGVPYNVNQAPGSTMVPGPRFREPVPRVQLVNRPAPTELAPIAPPPRPTRTAAVDDTPRRSRPDIPTAVPPARSVQRGVPPTLAQGNGRYNVTPQPPLPGNDPQPLKQPPGAPRVEQRTVPSAPQVPQRDIPPPRPRVHAGDDPALPTGRPRPTPAPAEPAVYPPGSQIRPDVPTPNPRMNPRNNPALQPAPGQPNAPATGPRLSGPISNQPTQIAPVTPDAPRGAPRARTPAATPPVAAPAPAPVAPPAPPRDVRPPQAERAQQPARPAGDAPAGQAQGQGQSQGQAQGQGQGQGQGRGGGRSDTPRTRTMER